MTTAPIVLFCYNRPWHTKETVTALAKNDLARESDLIVYADGAKNEAAESGVRAVREYLRTISGFHSVTIIERPENWGLARSIADGITNVLANHSSVIVMEDDIVTSSAFLRYMNQALILYDTDERVMHVSGYFHPVDHTGLPPTFFYNQASCWGWGTWARAWKHFSVDTKDLYTAMRAKPLPHQYHKLCLSQLRANMDGRITTWAAKWQASILLRNGLCLHPARSYVMNVGHDGTGIHSQSTTAFSLPTESLNMKTEVFKINDLCENQLAVSRADRFLKSLQPSLLRRVWNRLHI